MVSPEYPKSGGGYDRVPRDYVPGWGFYQYLHHADTLANFVMEWNNDPRKK